VSGCQEDIQCEASGGGLLQSKKFFTKARRGGAGGGLVQLEYGELVYRGKEEVLLSHLQKETNRS